MRKALVIGIDEYPGQPLTGCVADACHMSDLLSKHADGTPNFDCRLCAAPPSQITRATLREHVAELFADEVDVALLYFSGHGFLDATGGYLVTQDAARYDEGVSMPDVLTYATRSPAHEVVIILDCCYSGGWGQLPALAGDQALLREGMAVLAACGPEETALGSSGGGVFTSLLCAGLDGWAADVLGNVTIGSLYSHVELALGAWQQRPVFKANLSRFTPVRRCRPEVELEVLRLATQYFPSPGADLQLDPSYEPQAEPRDAQHELVFSHLQQYRAARLLVPVGEKHLYHAAMNRKWCRLTPLGWFYWHLAKAGRI
jgi:hypothetical protein